MEMSLILLSSVTTVCVLLEMPNMVSAIVSGVSTLLSAVMGYLKPKKKREEQLEASKDFKILMLRMVRTLRNTVRPDCRNQQRLSSHQKMSALIFL